MQVAVETLNELEHRIKISVPAEQITKEVDARVERLARTAKLDGFRPGKIPKNVIKDRYGKTIEIEVIDEAVRSSFQEAMKQENLKPAGVPDFKFSDEQFELGKPLDYTATFEIFPKIELKPFSQLEIEKLVAEITAVDIDQTLDNMRKQQAQWEEVDRIAKDGDRLTINLNGTIEGQPFAGGSAENMPVVLGSKTTILGFEEGLLGTRAGQSVTLNLQFPDAYHATELAGKPVVFAITVNKIEEPHLPELDDAFVERFGIKEGGLPKLREEVQQTLQRQLDRSLRRKLKAEVMKNLLAAYNEIRIPKALVLNEADRMLKEAQQQFAQMKTDKQPNFTLDMFTSNATGRVCLGLVINEIIKQHAIKPDAAIVRKLIEEIAENFDQSEQIITWYYHQKERLAEIEYLAMEEQIVDKILTEAKVKEKSSTLNDVLKEGEARG